MVRTLFALVTALLVARRVVLFELAGTTAGVVAASMWHPAAAWAVVSVALLAKSYTWDLRDSE